MKKIDFNNPPLDAQREARKKPNGYVYMVDEEYKNKQDVPPSAIVGYWKVNEKGKITGPFVHNPNHKSKLS